MVFPTDVFLSTVRKSFPRHSSVVPNIIKEDENKILSYIDEDLESYRHMITSILRQKKHCLSSDNEKLLAAFSPVLGSASDTYSYLTNADMKLGTIHDEENKEVELNESNFSRYIRSKDRRVRKESFEKLYESYAGVKNTIASLYGSILKYDSINAKLRGYTSSLESYLNRLKKYNQQIHICAERNSYSKTDHEAAFMRMKEDAMGNGQLKPAYNIQHGVDSEYITWIDISPHPTDTRTLIPFLKDMENHLGFKYSEVVADAGYESEENYLFIEGNGQTAYIKPQNYEISKTRKYKKDISRRENMEYHADRDSYICRNGRELTVTNERRSKTASGYVSVKTYYRSPDCTGCPYKTECIKGNNCKTPMEKRNKVLMVSKTMSQKRAEDLERITSEYGTMLRMNRSIQAEGSFADVKEDMNFRRYLYRGKANALAESILLAMGRNINKLHCKIQTGRTGSHLFSLKTA